LAIDGRRAYDIGAGLGGECPGKENLPRPQGYRRRRCGLGLAARPCCHVYLRPLHRQGITGKHHLMFPAVQTADAAIRSFVDLQPGAVAFAPGGALMKRRLELAMLSQYFAIASDAKKRAIHRTAGSLVDFGYAN